MRWISTQKFLLCFIILRITVFSPNLKKVGNQVSILNIKQSPSVFWITWTESTYYLKWNVINVILQQVLNYLCTYIIEDTKIQQKNGVHHADKYSRIWDSIIEIQVEERDHRSSLKMFLVNNVGNYYQEIMLQDIFQW